MPLQNRVLPDGSLVADPCRGIMMGNRGGCFHRDDQTLRSRHWHSKQWICCVLQFKNRHREVMQPRRYTELFFLDEATALAAGHRPCFECRREPAVDFAACWIALRSGSGRAIADAMDAVLHEERLDERRQKRLYRADIGSLPANAMVRLDGVFARIGRDCIQSWSLDGYGPPRSKPADREVEVLTPPSIVAVLGAGYRPVLHTSAAT